MVLSLLCSPFDPTHSVSLLFTYSGHLFGAQKYVWGNIPAFDVMRLESNVGTDYSANLRLLFAGKYSGARILTSCGFSKRDICSPIASGDLRNVIKTVARLPLAYSNALDITINDRDFDIVARNLILLLVALTAEKINEVVDCILPLWYSALVRESDIEVLQRRIRPLIEEVCGKIKEKTSSALCAKKWIFGQRSLRVVLGKSSWVRLLAFVSKPERAYQPNRHSRSAQLPL